MNFFENTLLDVILILFPLLICILYEAYNKVYDLEKNSLCLEFALVSSFYLVLRFRPDNHEFPYLLMNIPILIAYLKDKKLSILLLSIISSICMYIRYDNFLILLLLEYLSYYIVYKTLDKESNRQFKFLNIFIVLKIFFFLIYEVSSNINDQLSLYNIITTIITFVISSYIIEALTQKIEKIFKFEDEVKELKKEKDLRMSLFKITHEIKNPITVCKGYLEMFDVEDKNKSRKYVDIIQNEINRVLILLEDFLSINKIKIEKDIIDLNLLLEEITNNFIPILKDKGIKRKFEFDKEELFIMADYNRLSQVLINIIKNSIESIKENGLINIYTKTNKTNIKIYIEDNGIGMNEEELTKVMDPFFTTKTKGTGLGVYLSNQIIVAHGGNIKYFSDIDKGTKVVITIPYKKIEL